MQYLLVRMQMYEEWRNYWHNLRISAILSSFPFLYYTYDMIERKLIEVSTWTIFKTVLILLGLALLYVVRDIVVILLLSIVIASAIEPGIHSFISRFRFPRVLAVLAVYFLTASLLAFAFYLIVPPLVNEVQNFSLAFQVSLEDTLEELRGRASFIFSYAPEYISVPAESVTDNLNTFVNENIGSFFSLTSSLGSSLFGGALSFVLVIVLSFYFAVQENGIANVLKIIAPKEHEAYVIDLWRRSQHKIGKWLQGQLLLGVMVGVLVYIGLALLGVKYALVLAVIAAIFELIPIFGPIMAAIPSVLLAVIQAPILGLWVIVLYVIVQQMENHLIYPLVVRRAVGVPPLLVIIALLIGGKLGGVVGFVLAVPIAAAIVEYVNDVARDKHIFEN